MRSYETTQTCNIKLKQCLKYSKVTTKTKSIQTQIKKKTEIIHRLQHINRTNG